MTARPAALTPTRPRQRAALLAVLAVLMVAFVTLYSAMLLGEARSRADTETAAALPWIAALLPQRASHAGELRALMARLADIRHVSVALHTPDGTRLAEAPTVHPQPPRWLPAPATPPAIRQDVRAPDGTLVGYFMVRPAPADEMAELWADYTRSLALMAALALLGLATLLLFNRMAGALDQAEARRQALLRKLLDLDDQARRRLAHDLHDEVSPYLVALQPLTATLQQQCAERPDTADLAAPLATLAAHLGQVLGTLRRILTGLHPPALQTLGLPGALTQLVRVTPATLGVQADVQLRLEGSWQGLGPLLDVQVYRLVQECLTNALRHGGRHIALHLRHAPQALQLVITNDRAAAPLPAESAGLGTLGLHERCLALGGSCTVGPDGDGWRVHIHLPLETDTHAD